MDGTRSSHSDRFFEIRCDVPWHGMRVVDAARESRRCDRCERTVYLCRTVEEFERHARQAHCVALDESGPFARVRANAPEVPESSDDSPTPEDALDPLDPEALTPLPPRPPREVRIPTAGVPRKVDMDETAPDGSTATVRPESS
jgi:hypothetical protein